MMTAKLRLMTIILKHLIVLMFLILAEHSDTWWGVGLTPTGQVSNSSENVLNNQKNVVSSNGEYVIEFIDKYIDDNNNKIC